VSEIAFVPIELSRAIHLYMPIVYSKAVRSLKQTEIEAEQSLVAANCELIARFVHGLVNAVLKPGPQNRFDRVAGSHRVYFRFRRTIEVVDGFFTVFFLLVGIWWLCRFTRRVMCSALANVLGIVLWIMTRLRPPSPASPSVRNAA
jgi:hypothetical protein